MSLHAFDDIDDAVDATKSLLLPFGWRKWFYYALVALFIGGGTSFPTFGQGFTGGTPSPSPGAENPELPAAVGAIVIAVVLFALLLGLLFSALSSILEFVFFEAMREQALEIRAGLSRHLGKGLRLFGFRIVLGIVAIVPIAVFALTAFLLGPAVLLLLLGIPVLIVYYVVIGLVGGFTTMFVVPLMLAEDRGVLSGWRRLWPAVRSNLKEFAAYAFMGFVLNIASGFVVGFGALFAGLLLAIPFGVVFGGLFFLLGGPAAIAGAGITVTAGLVAGVVGVLLFVVCFLVGLGYVQAPLQAFLRYYAVLVLGDVAPDLDPIAEVRREIRADGGDAGTDGPDAGSDTDSDDTGFGSGSDETDGFDTGSGFGDDSGTDSDSDDGPR
jgi:hypothetical protein